MAGCASNFGVTRVVSVGKEAVLKNQYSNLSRLSFRVVLKEAAFPVIFVNKCGRSSSYVSIQKKPTFLTMCMSQPPADSQSVVTTVEFSEGGSDSVVRKEQTILDSELGSKTDGNDNNGVVFDGSGGNGSIGNGGEGDSGGGGDGDDGNDEEGEEFGPILKYDEVLRETEARGVTLPLDMLEAAKSVGIRKLLLLRYLDLQVHSLNVHSCISHFFQSSDYVLEIASSCTKEDDHCFGL